MKRKRAIGYIRVSSDEQSKNNSPKEQEDLYVRFCESSNIENVKMFYDDYTGKTFDRPGFNQLLAYVKKFKGEINYVYFKNWSRFGRNIVEAYSAIDKLKSYGVEVQAIEQPLDFSVPESKIMLAVYIAIPEADNDRRSLTIRSNMRKAKRDGRCICAAPKGYKNTRDEQNKPIIVPSELAPLVIEAFTELSNGIVTQEEIRQKLNQRGLKCSRNNFSTMLRNPLYVGKVFVPAYKDEPAELVKGIHQALISEEIFYKVQDILNGRREAFPTKNSKRDELPLRGFLVCKECGKKLTGSASRGRHGGRFFYYHCGKGCKERFSAKLANEQFLNLLKEIKPSKYASKIYQEIAEQIFKSNENEIKQSFKKIDEEIAKNTERIGNAQQLMVDSKIDAGEYRIIKARYEEIIFKLKRQKVDNQSIDNNYSSYLESSLKFLSNIDNYYEEANVEMRQKIVGSVFPEKLIFEKNAYRTPKLNEIVEAIYLKKNELEGQKNRGSKNFITSSHSVASTGIEPVSKV